MRLASSVAFAVALLAPAAAAHADVFSIRAEAHGGGAGGIGLGGERKDDAFYTGARGPAYGALIGAEILFIDAWVAHQQIPVDGEVATWTEFMAGLDLDIGVGAPPKAPGAKDDPKPKGYLELGVGVGFGVGTGQQVELPLDNGEVTDKGFLVEGKLGAGIHLGPVLSLGVVVPVSAGYYFKSGAGVVANDLGTHYQALDASVLVSLRFRLKLK